MSLLRTTRGGKAVDFALSNGGVLLGTAPGCQIVVADPGAAPKHCRIARSPQGFVVTDLSGGGGTVVNGAKIKEHVLRDGDVLQIGSEKFTFAEKKPEPARPAAPVAAAKVAVASGSPASAAPTGGRRPLPSRAPRAAGGNRPAAAAAPRKLTAKPGSVARVHKDHALFALPSTAKGKTIAIAVGLGLVVLGGILFVISSGTKSSEEVKKLAEADIQKLNAIPEANIKERYDKVLEIVSNPDYQKMAGKEIQPALKARDPLKALLELETRAAQVVKPFMENYRSAKEGPPEDFKKQWQSFYDTVNVHLDNFERTSFGPELTKIRADLKLLLENVGPSWSDEFVKLSREVSRLIAAGNFGQALVDIDSFGTRFGEKESNQLKTRLQGERDRVKDRAKDHIDKLKAEAAGKATKEEKRKHLEAARPFIKGFPDVERYLDKCLSELK